MDEDGQDEDRDGDEDVRGRQFSEISGTSEDEDGEDVDVLRRPGHDKTDELIYIDSKDSPSAFQAIFPIHS